MRPRQITEAEWDALPFCSRGCGTRIDPDVLTHAVKVGMWEFDADEPRHVACPSAATA